MSHIEATWAYKLPIKDRNCKLLFIQLCDLWTSDKGCFPSIRLLCDRIVASDRTVQRLLKRLEAKGLLRRDMVPGRVTRYAINFEWSSPPTDSVTPAKSVTPDNLAPTPPTLGVTTPPTPTVTLTNRTKVREPIKTPLPLMEEMHGEQTNGHNGAALGLGLLPAEHLAGDGQDRCACDHAKDAWNQLAERVGWPKVQRFTPPRAKALEARLAEIGGLAKWQEMLGKMAASRFFTERWPPSFDWILKPANLTKIIEGNYDNRGPPNRDAEIEAAIARSRT